jgi:hypothetical protein
MLGAQPSSPRLRRHGSLVITAPRVSVTSPVTATVPLVQRVSANAIQALKDALTAAFWWRKDLYNYAKAAVRGEPTFLAGIDWLDAYKRDSVSTFVDRLVREQDQQQELLLDLMFDVASIDDFPQLRRTEDPEAKIAEAREAVARLRALVKPYEEALLARQRESKRIDASKVEAAERRATTQRLAELMARYLELMKMTPQQRGFALERLLRDLFDTFDLDPRASFRVTGEQIDGGFTIDGMHFVLEAKWEKAPADRAALDTFHAKVERRADITQGLFVAIEGFEPTAVELHSRRGSHLILMNGADLYAALESRIDLRELLRRKLRHAAMTGDILYTAGEILAGS